MLYIVTFIVGLFTLPILNHRYSDRVNKYFRKKGWKVRVHKVFESKKEPEPENESGA